MRTVRTYSEPQRVVTGAGVHLHLDLVPPRQTARLQPMEAIREAVPQSVAEHDHGREPDPLGKTLGILGDELLVDRLAHLSARIHDDLIQSKHAAFRHLIERGGRSRRRGQR